MRSGKRAAARFSRSPIATRPMRPGPGTPPVASKSVIVLSPAFRHCEERSDEAIQSWKDRQDLDCFASLAMTDTETSERSRLTLIPHSKDLPGLGRRSDLAPR